MYAQTWPTRNTFTGIYFYGNRKRQVYLNVLCIDSSNEPPKPQSPHRFADTVYNNNESEKKFELIKLSTYTHTPRHICILTHVCVDHPAGHTPLEMILMCFIGYFCFILYAHYHFWFSFLFSSLLSHQ